MLEAVVVEVVLVVQVQQEEDLQVELAELDEEVLSLYDNHYCIDLHCLYFHRHTLPRFPLFHCRRRLLLDV